MEMTCLLQNAFKSVHVIARPAASAINGEEPVLVYDSKEFKCKWNADY